MEDVKAGIESLTEKEDKLGFVKKVYGIISAQFILTMLLCVIPFVSDSARDWMLSYGGQWLAICSCIVALMIACVIACVKPLARKTPHNYLLLTAFTLTFGYSVAAICAWYSPDVVLTAAGLTACIVLGLTLFAFSGIADFTILAGMLVVLLFASLAFMIVTLIVGFYSYIGWCYLGVFLYGLYLVIDTSIIMGGKRYKMFMDEYVLCAMILYIDMIMIFLYILRILGGR